MARKSKPLFKAFVLCDEIREQPNKTKVDLFGAGLSTIKSLSTPPFPCKCTFWAYLLLADEKPEGHARLAIMRADSGRRYFFRELTIQRSDPLTTSQLAVRIFNFEFPEKGVYYVELWYDDRWLLDHRLELNG
jgi:hypothetical protein